MAGETDAGKVFVSVHADEKPFRREMSSLDGVASRFGKNIGKKFAAAFATGGILKFSKSCLELGSDLAEVQNVVDVAFPKMSKTVDKFAKGAAASFGLSETMAKRYTGTFGAMSKAFGFTEKEAAGMATALTGLAGDVASFYNLSQDEAYTKLKSVFTGETESLKDLGVVMTQTALDQYAMANGFGKTTQAMTEQEKVALRYQFVTSQLALAQGDFARTSDSWANQTRLLTLQFESLKASIGQGLINVLTPAIKALNVFMAKLVQAAGVFQKFTQKVFGKSTSDAGNMSAAVSDVGVSAGNASTGLGKLGKSSNKAGKAARKAAKELKKSQKDLAGFDKINKLAAKNKSTGSSGTGGGGKGVKGVGGGAGGAGGALTGLDSSMDESSKKSLKLGKIWDNLRKSVARLKKAFSEFWGLMKSAGKWVLDNILIPLGKWTISELLPRLVDILAAAFRVLTKVLEALEPVWKTLWKIFFKPLAKFTGRLIIKALDLIAAGLNKIADFAEKHPKAFRVIVVSLLGLLALKKVSPVLSLAAGKFQLFSRAIKVFGKGNGLKGFGKLGAVLFKRTKLFAKFASVAGKFKKAGSVLLRFGSIAAKGFRVVGAALAANPIAAIIGAIAIAAFLIYKNWNKIKKTKAGKVLIKVGKTIKNLGNIVAKAFAHAVRKKITQIADAVKKVKDTWNGITTKAKELKASVEDKASEILGDIKDKWDGIKEGAKELIAEGKEKVAGALQSLKDKWDGIEAGTKKLVTDTIENIQKNLSSKWKKGKSIFTSFVKAKGGEIKKKLTTIKGKWNKAAVKTFNAIKEGTTTATKKIKTKGSKALKKLKAVWDAFTGTKTVELKATLKAVASKAWNAAANKLNKARKAHPKLLGWLPTLPTLASGGWVQKNTPQLAVVGDNRHHSEIVAPDDKLAAMARQAAHEAAGSGGSNADVVRLLMAILAAINSIDPDVYLDGKEITKKVVSNINRTTKSTGRVPIIL